LENLDDDYGYDYDEVDISMAWEIIRESIKASPTESLGCYELKQHKLWFDEKCPKLGERKQAKLQWLQNSSQTNGDNMNSVRHETSRTFRNKRRGYLKKKHNQLKTNSKDKNIRDICRGTNEFKVTNLELT
jgi:hypothetical protein